MDLQCDRKTLLIEHPDGPGLPTKEMSAMRRYVKMKIAMSCFLTSTLAGSLGVCVADAAGAMQTVEVVTRRVSFADLDMGRDAGAATLYLRIRLAARQVCEPEFATWNWKSQVSTNRCMEHAIAQAVEDVNAPKLTSYHMARAKRTIRVAEKR
jgi:UrcA family protein